MFIDSAKATLQVSSRVFWAVLMYSVVNLGWNTVSTVYWIFGMYGWSLEQFNSFVNYVFGKPEPYYWDPPGDECPVGDEFLRRSFGKDQDVVVTRDWKFAFVLVSVTIGWMMLGAFLVNKLIAYVYGHTKAIFRPESVNAEHPLMRGKEIPKYQAEMYDARGNFIGFAVRIRDWLCAPEHVWQESTCCKKSGREFTLRQPRHVATDFVALQLDADEWSTLGLCKPTVASELHLAYAMGPKGYYSIGPLSRSSIIGGLNYGGSTVAGFSGTSYDVQQCIVGVHIGGQGPNRANFGYSASYLNALLTILEKPERQDDGEQDHVNTEVTHDVMVGGRKVTLVQSGNNWRDLIPDEDVATKKNRLRSNVGPKKTKATWGDEVNEEELEELTHELEELSHIVKQSAIRVENLEKENALLKREVAMPKNVSGSAVGKSSGALSRSESCDLLESQSEGLQRTQESSKQSRRRQRRLKAISDLRDQVAKLSVKA